MDEEQLVKHQLELNLSNRSDKSPIKRKRRRKRQKTIARMIKWQKTKIIKWLRGVEGLINASLALLLALYLLWVLVKAILLAGTTFGVVLHIPHAIKLAIDILERIFSK